MVERSRQLKKAEVVPGLFNGNTDNLFYDFEFERRQKIKARMAADMELLRSDLTLRSKPRRGRPPKKSSLV